MKNLYFLIVSLFCSLSSFAIGPITGDTSICVGSTIYMSDTATGGGWWSSDNSIARIYSSTSGAVTGIAAGTATITYTVGGSFVTQAVVVLPSPTVSGPWSMCPSDTATFTSTMTGGTWSTSNSLLATITPGGLAYTSTISTPFSVIYTLPTGCMGSWSLTIGPPSSGVIVGASTVCAGATIWVSDATRPTGTWSTVNGNATISGTGLVTGVTAGLDTILYTVSTICGTATARKPITVTGSTVLPISGPASMCVGSTIYLTDATAGGAWTGSGPGISVGSTNGAVTGMSAGSYTVTYTLLGCSGSVYATYGITVGSAPSAIVIPSNVCPGSCINLSDATAGGTWSTSSLAIATINPTTGIVCGASTGTANITYSISVGCTATGLLTVGPPVAGSISGPSTVCVGYTISLSETASGGVWSSTSPVIASVSVGGVVTGASTGVDTIKYSITSSCGTAVAIHPVTVTGTAGAITGPSHVCTGTSIYLSDAIAGGTWSTSAPAIATTGSAMPSGYVGGVSTGTATITYSVAGCGGTLYTTYAITVDSTPVVMATAIFSCGGMYTLTGASGYPITTYNWSPSAGLSCTACAVATITPSATSNYYVTGTTAAGCVGTSSSVLVNANRISGNIIYTGGLATDSFRVWLTQYNPVDSSITATDSTVSCMSGSTPYYHFENPPIGNYFVKAKLFGSVPGSSGWIPTYGLSSSVWSAATNINHVSSPNGQNINMIYGAVPPGPGFISGNVYSGAGKGTSGEVPVEGMLIYLKNSTSGVLTYTFTDAAGAYSFSGLAYGDYYIWPEEFSYYTTPSATLTLDATHTSATGVNFKEHTDNGTITPFDVTGITTISSDVLSIYPNPAADKLTIQWNEKMNGDATVVITDMLGREVFSSTVSATASSQLNISALKAGIYMISVLADHVYFSSKLEIRK